MSSPSSISSSTAITWAAPVTGQDVVRRRRRWRVAGGRARGAGAVGASRCVAGRRLPRVSLAMTAWWTTAGVRYSSRAARGPRRRRWPSARRPRRPRRRPAGPSAGWGTRPRRPWGVRRGRPAPPPRVSRTARDAGTRDGKPQVSHGAGWHAGCARAPSRAARPPARARRHGRGSSAARGRAAQAAAAARRAASWGSEVTTSAKPNSLSARQHLRRRVFRTATRRAVRAVPPAASCPCRTRSSREATSSRVPKRVEAARGDALGAVDTEVLQHAGSAVPHPHGVGGAGRETGPAVTAAVG